VIRKYSVYMMDKKYSSTSWMWVYRLARLALDGKMLVKQAHFEANLARFEVSGRLARLA
jgi:hypothetical protein